MTGTPFHFGGVIRIPHEPCGIRIPLARKSAGDLKDFRAMSFPQIAQQSCGNRMTVAHALDFPPAPA
jgi:hypothetical protein